MKEWSVDRIGRKHYVVDSTTIAEDKAIVILIFVHFNDAILKTFS